MKVFTQRNIEITFLAVFLTSLFVLIIHLIYENAADKFIEDILEEYEYCKKVMKKYFNKNLILTEKEEENS